MKMPTPQTAKCASASASRSSSSGAAMSSPPSSDVAVFRRSSAPPTPPPPCSSVPSTPSPQRFEDELTADPSFAAGAASGNGGGGGGGGGKSPASISESSAVAASPSPGSLAATAAARGGDESTAQMRRVLGRIRRQKRRSTRGGGGKYSNLGEMMDGEDEYLTPPSSPNSPRSAAAAGSAGELGCDYSYGAHGDDDGGVEVLEVTASFGVEENAWFQTMCPKCCRMIFRFCRRGTGCFCGKDENEDIDDIARNRPTNEMLLSTAFVSFMGFTILQSIVAVAAESKAMMGDSAAMAVDALTYAFNLFAERRKNRSESEPPPDCSRYGDDPEAIARALQRYAREKKKLKLRLELVPPLVSVTTLVVVIGIVLDEAVRVLVLDVHRSAAQQSSPNVVVMGVFSALNLGLDFLNVFCFAKARHAMGFATMDEEDTEVMTVGEDGDGGCDDNEEGSVGESMASANSSPRSPSPKSPSRRKAKKKRRIKRRTPAYAHLPSSVGDEMWAEQNGGEEDQSMGTNGSDAISPSPSLELPELGHEGCDSRRSSPLHMNGVHNELGRHSGVASDRAGDGGTSHETANLNMCSAYTHVFADTLRSLAVVIASVLAMTFDGITPEVVDATAAVLVSMIILLSLGPLLHGMCHTWSELKSIRREEAAETDLPDLDEMYPEVGTSTLELGMGFA